MDNRCVMCNSEITEGYGQVCYNCQKINEENTEKSNENQNYWEWVSILSLFVLTQIGEKRTIDIIPKEHKEKCFEDLSNKALKVLKSKIWEIIQKEGIEVTNQNLDWLLERAFKEIK